MTNASHRVVPSAGRQAGAAVGMLLAVVFVAALGSLASLGHTDGWYAGVEKVQWSPPNWVFGPAWSALYLLIAISGFLLWRRGFRGPGTENEARSILMLFIAQLALNSLWNPVFFAGYPLIGQAAWWIAMVIMVLLIVLVAWLIIVTMRYHVVASLLLVPYLGWLLFASTLNAGIIALN